MGIHALILAVALASASGHEAEVLAKRAEASYQAGHLKEALAQASQAYKLAPSPGLLLVLGRCHAALGDLAEAASAYHAYLKERPHAADRAAVQERLADLEARAHPGNELQLVPLLAPEPLVAAPAVAPKIVEAQPAAPPAPPPAAQVAAPPAHIAEAPPAATETPSVEASAPASHSHVTSLLLGAGAAVAVGFLIAGIADVSSYNAYLSSAQQHPGTLAWDPGRSSAASAWEAVAVAGGILAAAGVTGAVLTW